MTDHRINLTLYKLDKVIAGEALDELIEALITEDQAAQLAAMEQTPERADASAAAWRGWRDRFRRGWDRHCGARCAAAGRARVRASTRLELVTREREPVAADDAARACRARRAAARGASRWRGSSARRSSTG